MNTIIIDDNPSAQQFLADLLQIHCKEVVLLGKAYNIVEGKKLIQLLHPELVFLDVEMPKGTGLELLQQLEQVNFKVIFTTAHEKYALKAIKYSALDYLLKPIDPSELITAVNKAQAKDEQQLSKVKMNNLRKNLGENSAKNQRIILKDKYGMQITTVQEIIHLEADDYYTKFFIQDQTPVVVSKPLKEYEAILPKDQFFRCHKSHLVNLDYVMRYDKKDDNVLILKNGNLVPVSRRRLESLMNRLENH